MVMVVQRLPAVRDVAPRHVARHRVPGVVAHEARQVAAIPVRCGADEHRCDLGLRIAERDLRGQHAATARTRYHARPMERLCGMKLDWNAPRERLREMALTIRTALPRRVDEVC